MVVSGASSVVEVKYFMYNWVPVVVTMITSTVVIVRALKRMVAPIIRLARQHEFLLVDYSIRTECDDVPVELPTGLRDPNIFYRKHPWFRPHGPEERKLEDR